MEYIRSTKEAFVLVGYSSAGSWKKGVYPIPELWDKASRLINKEGLSHITGVCLPPRSDDYFYTCGFEMNSVQFEKIDSEMTLHTFPKQEYLLFIHKGPASQIPLTYGRIWNTFDKEGYSIKSGSPEIEVVCSSMFGKEDDPSYEMKIYIPIEFKTPK